MARARNCLSLVPVCYLWLPHTLLAFWSYLLLHILTSQGQRPENSCPQHLLQLQHRSEAWLLPIVYTEVRAGFSSGPCEEVVRRGALSIPAITVVETSTFSELPASRHERHWGQGGNGCDSEVFTEIVPMASLDIVLISIVPKPSSLVLLESL